MKPCYTNEQIKTSQVVIIRSKENKSGLIEYRHGHSQRKRRENNKVTMDVCPQRLVLSRKGGQCNQVDEMKRLSPDGQSMRVFSCAAGHTFAPTPASTDNHSAVRRRWKRSVGLVQRSALPSVPSSCYHRLR